MKNLDVIALGGNAIVPVGKTGTIREQFAVTESAMDQVVGLLVDGRNVVITHGNGPIVGNIVLRSEALKDKIPPMPLDVCGADSQGGIGYMIQQTLRNALVKRGLEREVAAVVTQVLVNDDDPAFQNPVKPIGPYYTKQEAQRVEKERGWKTASDSTRGYRRVVPSPYPVGIVEERVIKTLLESGVIVVTLGGGGIPVVFSEGRYRGREAVVDKDLASSLLARDLAAERMIILTDVDAVYKDFGTDRAVAIRRAAIEEIAALYEAGYFPQGSMGSKIQAAIEFLDGGGRTVVICGPEHLTEGAAGRRGTMICREPANGH